MRVVGVDPTRRGLCFAVLEGPRRLIGWGCTMARRQKPDRVRRAAQRLLDEYEPDFVVLEDSSGSRRGQSARRSIEVVRHEALEYGAGVRVVSRQQVREAFGSARATKDEIARAVATQFPQLRRIQPRQRRLWDPEDDRMNVFDAASFALTAIPQLTS